MLLVTGITGHTGKYFLQELIDNKYDEPVRCIIRERSDTILLDNSGLNIEKLVGDLSDTEFIKKAMSGVDTIMHIYNIHHSPMIIEAAIENEVKRAILIHTTGIYSNFKYASEEYKNIEKRLDELTKSPHCPTKITILRPTMIYGDLCDRNMSKFIKMIDKLRFIPVIDGGKSYVQPVNARDLGKAYYTVLKTTEKTVGKAYDLSGGKPLKTIEVFAYICKELGKERTFVSVPLKLGVILARILKVLSLRKIDYVERVQRMGENRSYPHDDAERDFNFNPMSFDEGIREEVRQYLQLK